MTELNVFFCTYAFRRIEIPFNSSDQIYSVNSVVRQLSWHHMELVYNILEIFSRDIFFNISPGIEMFHIHMFQKDYLIVKVDIVEPLKYEKCLT